MSLNLTSLTTLASRPLPRWLREGIGAAIAAWPLAAAQMPDATEIARHRTFWNSDRTQSFWSGDAFDAAGIRDYATRVAFALVHLLLRDHASCRQFIEAAACEDAGAAAFYGVYSHELHDLPCSLLGPGPWAEPPSPPHRTPPPSTDDQAPPDATADNAFVRVVAELLRLPELSREHVVDRLRAELTEHSENPHFVTWKGPCGDAAVATLEARLPTGGGPGFYVLTAAPKQAPDRAAVARRFGNLIALRPNSPNQPARQISHSYPQPRARLSFVFDADSGRACYAVIDQNEP